MPLESSVELPINFFLGWAEHLWDKSSLPGYIASSKPWIHELLTRSRKELRSWELWADERYVILGLELWCTTSQKYSCLIFSIFYILGVLPSLHFPFFYFLKMDGKKAWIGLHGMEGEKDWTTKGNTSLFALEWIGFINCWIGFGASLK